MTATSPSAPRANLGLLLSKASHALWSASTVALAEVGITPRAYCVLTNASTGVLTQIQLAELCGLDKTTMVVTVDELEAAGLAERHPSPTDRRVRIITVTEAGRRVAAEAQQIVERVQDEVLAVIPVDEREALVSGLTRLVGSPLCTRPAVSPPGSRRPRGTP
ncbi:MAG: MarR family winged helix-turn-helix transcriptional regulator [Natronosporangium sp.]